MTLDQLKQDALALGENDRAELAAILLNSLPPPEVTISDEEVDQREQEMDNATVQPLSHEELIKRVEADRKG